ncbi:MAG: zinc ABC transporter substrate-binding protein, partial [Paramuribaculum sp.]|nr:zinc ABC transporter substrate-binding protein [Paramuribaculum sp.]
MNKHKIYFLFLAILTLTSCSSKKAVDSNGKLTVCVSLEPQRWILEQIGGDKLNAVSFLPGDANPENFDPPMSALKTASESALYMRMGHLPWENSLIERITASNPDIRVIDSSNGIEPIHGTHGHSHPHSHNDDVDPHTWSSVKNARIIAANMYEALSESDSSNADYYTERYRALDNKLDSLDKAYTSRLAPLRGASVLVWHPSLSYYARDYGLNQISIGMENKETTPIGMQRQLEMAAGHNPIVFLVQPQ